MTLGWHGGAFPAPSRPTWCRLSPRWPGVRLREEASTKQCAMCSGCVKWEASLSQTIFDTHTTSSHTQFFTHMILSHTSFTHTALSHTTLHIRSSTTSFVFPSFSVLLQLLFPFTGRSWLVGLSGPLFFWRLCKELPERWNKSKHVETTSRRQFFADGLVRPASSIGKWSCRDVQLHCAPRDLCGDGRLRCFRCVAVTVPGWFRADFQDD